MSDTTKAVLLVTDISGYTSFMKQHAISVNHAKQIIVRLLKALMAASKPPLKVAELEGDAVFFFAIASENNIETTVSQVKNQILRLFSAFKKELEEINKVKTCACDACDHVHDLQLKQVIHVGDVAVERIDRFEKLFGLDVILVHRMLKNSVEAKEYVMVTDPMFSAMRDFFGLSPERRKEVFEGVGEVETLVFYPRNLAPPEETSLPRDPGALKKLAWRMEISMRFAAEKLGLTKFEGEFKNLPQ